MKKIFSLSLFSLVSLNTLVFAANRNDAHVNIAKIALTPTPHLETFTLNNTSKIDYIITTGPYAWALNNNYDETDYSASAIFFDGKQWDSAGGHNIPGLRYTTAFQPAYPISGIKPYAWILGSGGGYLNYLVSYFNGKQWTPLQSVRTIFNNLDISRCDLKASAGRAYLFCKISSNSTRSTQTVYVTMDANSETEQTWSLPRYLAGEANTTDSFNDITPYLFLLMKSDDYKTFNFMKINPDYSTKNFPIEDLDRPYALGELLVDGDRIYLNYTYTTQEAPQLNWNKFAYAGNNGETSWYHSLIANSSNIIIHDQSQTENSGFFCNNTHAFSDPESLTLTCIDFNHTSPAWDSEVTVVNYPKAWINIVRNNGEWIVYGIKGSRLNIHVMDYDSKSQTLKDTHFPTQSNIYFNARALNLQTILTCTYSKDLKPTLSFYDRTHPETGWQMINTDQTLVRGCGLSNSGNPVHTRNINPNNNETLWIFMNHDPKVL
jgi:hypothetical protein